MITVGYIRTGHYDYQDLWSSDPNSAGGVSVRIRFRNDSDKTIKYIRFQTYPFNAVGDRQSSQYSNQNGYLELTGPISPGAICEPHWENVWYNSTIVNAIIYEVEIDYMDGSSENIEGHLLKYEAMGGGCYVATAVYGSYDCPEVWTLRRFRDNILSTNIFGRAFIKFYYAVSPTLVKWFGQNKWFKNLFKPSLDRLVENLNAKGVENTPYDD